MQEDSKLVSLLDDLEQEDIPDRLLELARELQRELSLRRQRRNSN